MARNRRRRRRVSETEQEMNNQFIWDEYEAAKEYMSLPNWGGASLFECVDKNNQYFEGIHWGDFASGEAGVELPIFNICKQIGKAQVAIIASNVLTANYSWEDVPGLYEEGSGNGEEPQTAGELARFLGNEELTKGSTPSNEEMRAVALMLSKYFRTFSNRTNLNFKVKNCVTDAYKNGTGLLYFWWNDNIRNMGARGDISVESVEVVNVLVGDPTIQNLQEQPYILMEKRISVKEARKIAEANGLSENCDSIQGDAPDETVYGPYYEEISRDDNDPEAKCTVVTRFWKDIENGKTKVYVAQCTQDVMIKEKTDTKLTVYPLAYMPYEQKRGTFYAHTPLTEIIPNQRTANLLRYNQIVQDSYSAQPILLYDEARIPKGISNQIGAQIPVQGNINDVARYLQGQGMAASSENLAQLFMNDTLNINDVNAAVRGDLNPDNTSAIIALRDAAKMPLQLTSANLYMMFEDVARIVSDFIMGFYGKRSLRIEEKGESYIVPFDANRYRDYMLSVHIDVGESTLWSETATIRTLDNLLVNGQITGRQYLERVPDGYVPMKQELLNEMRQQEQLAQQQAAMEQMAAQQAQGSAPPEQQAAPAAPAVDWTAYLSGLSDEELEILQNDPTAQRELTQLVTGR